MKLPSHDLNGLLSKPATPNPAPKRRQAPKRSGREIARANELKAMQAVARFGHLRIAELAPAVWPLARYGEQLARRTAARLVGQGLLWRGAMPWGPRACASPEAGQHGLMPEGWRRSTRWTCRA